MAAADYQVVGRNPKALFSLKVHRGEGISNSVKYWIKPNIENRIKNGEIKAHFRSEIVEMR